jgi:anti-sigma28 factor (negative regulator of flagellin synthesis)
MIDGIRQNLTYLEPGARKGSKAEAAASSTRSPVSGSSAAAAESFIDVTSASSGGAAPLDRTRIEAIRDAIRNNAYPVDFDQLAERMIDVDFNRRGDQAF